MTVKQFKTLCEEQGDEFCEFYDETENWIKPTAFEDDGFLHVRFRKVRACFDLYGRTAKDRNDSALRVLTKLGMEDLYGPSTMVDESENDEDSDCCPECGCHCPSCGW